MEEPTVTGLQLKRSEAGLIQGEVRVGWVHPVPGTALSAWDTGLNSDLIWVLQLVVQRQRR